MSKSSREKPRLREAERHQLEFRSYNLDSLLPDDHRARLLWAAVGQLELTSFYDAIEARGSRSGRPATDPKVLLTLWLYAISEGVGSARHLARLCERDNVYRWICGGLSMNHHTLADFRAGHGEKLDGLMTQLLATLMHQGLVTLRRVSQDGVRVRASAGAGSFRRRVTLNKCLKEAKAQVRELRRQLEEEAGADNKREQAAKERAARERQERLARALAELDELEKQDDNKQLNKTTTKKRKKSKKKAKPKKKAKANKRERRVSTTDHQARVMKMGDGGWRPAYNIQFSQDTDENFIVGVGVTNIGSDKSQMVPMYEQVIERTGVRPREWLVDGGFVKLEAIHEMEAKGTRVYGPVPKSRNEEIDPFARKPTDTDETWRWRRRMKTESAKKKYRQRGAHAELVNADMRAWRGLQQLPVRGQPKVKTMALWMALTYNLLKWVKLVPMPT
ncbi:MAG: IS1182 family transposase [Thalassovita sp.]